LYGEEGEGDFACLFAKIYLTDMFKCHLCYVSYFRCKKLQKTKLLLGFKNKGNPPKEESLVFLETTVYRVGEKAKNQPKTSEKPGENPR
jgi:hypothetical protein